MSQYNKNISGVSGWSLGTTYSKFDVVYFTGHDMITDDQNNPRQTIKPVHSGYYYCNEGYTQASDASSLANSPTGASSKWTQEFFFSPSYSSSVSFTAQNSRITYGDGYFSLVPRTINNLHANFNLEFPSRTSSELRAMTHLIESKALQLHSGAASGITGYGSKPQHRSVTGFRFTPFYPYD